MKKILLFMASAAAALSMVSCAGAPDVAGEWNVVKIDGKPIGYTQEVPFLGFDAGQGHLYGNTGVNIINGGYTIDGNKLHFVALGTTMMAGPEQDMLVEQQFLAAINDVTTVKSGGDNIIILYGKDGNVLMELEKR